MKAKLKRNIRIQLRIYLYCFVLLTVVGQVYSPAQGSAGTSATLESRALIDLPTSGMLSHGKFALDMDFYQGGGLLVRISSGVFNRLLLGISYGGGKIIGTEQPTWNSVPGYSVRFRIIEETMAIPAIAFGFDSQGKEFYIDSLSRYAIKSLGFYVVASKNYEVLGFLSVHGGINYSLERADGDKDPNLFLGIEKTLGSIISTIAEYNLSINDSNQDALGKGRGYLNIGIRASIGDGFTLGFNLKDITRNQQDLTVGNRTMMLEYGKSL